MNVPATTQDLFTEIRELILKARQHVATQVNTELLATYWQIGRMIVEHEQNHQERADYGKQVLKQLSKALSQEFGRGFSRSNLYNMRLFYLDYPNSRHCLEICPGPITANCSQSPTQQTQLL